MEGISGFDADEDFYEDDEPIDKIVTAFNQGEKFVTTQPVTIEIAGPAQLSPSSWRWPVRVSLHAAPVVVPVVLARA
jgi:hypothetical protein